MEIGTGHFYRCFSIALALRDHHIIFLGDIQSKDLKLRVLQEGFKLIEIPSLEEIKNDLETTLKTLSFYGAESLVVDIPNLDPEWEESIAALPIAFTLFVDRPSRRYLAKVIISPNLFVNQNPFDSYTNEHTEVLLGPSYLLFRPEFYDLNPYARSRGQIHSISSFFGGADPGLQSQMVLELAMSREFSSIQFSILAGQLNPNYNQMLIVARSFANIEILSSTHNIAKLFLDSDLAFGSYGTSGWERCLMGTPAICTMQNGDQLEDAIQLNRLGVAINLGYSTEVNYSTLYSALLGLLNDSDRLRNMSENAIRVMSNHKEHSRITLSKILGEVR